MDRTDLQHLSKEQLIELVLQLQRPDKNSRTLSKPPSPDKKEKRENSRPGGAKLGHEPHNRRLAEPALRLSMRPLRRRGESSGAHRRDDHAVWAAHSCAGDLSQGLPGSLL